MFRVVNKVPYEVNINSIDQSLIPLNPSWNSNLHSVIIVRGDVFFVDRDIADFLITKRCYLTGNGYVLVQLVGRKESLHRLVNKTRKGYIADHINRNKRDNRSCNLREVHNSLNNHNQKRHDGLKGIRQRKTNGKWVASITSAYGSRNIGTYYAKEDAAKAYDLAAIEIYGKDANTNFPIENYKIPENRLIDSLTPSVPIKKDIYKKCKECEKSISRFVDLCKSCSQRIKRREEKIKKGLNPVFYRKRVNEKKEICIVDGCLNKVFSANMCGVHYHELRRHEGYIKPPKVPSSNYRCEVIDDGGNKCGRTAIKIKERLCSTHYKEKYGLFKTKGRPKSDKSPCKICGELGSRSTGFCKKHYLQNYNKRLK